MNKANKIADFNSFPLKRHKTISIISFCSGVFKHVCAVCVFVTSMERCRKYIACKRVQKGTSRQ